MNWLTLRLLVDLYWFPALILLVNFSLMYWWNFFVTFCNFMRAVTKKFQNCFSLIARNLRRFSLTLCNKSCKFQLSIINPHLFTSICFQCGLTRPQNCPKFAQIFNALHYLLCWTLVNKPLFLMFVVTVTRL